MARLTKQQKWVCVTVLSLGIVSAVLGLFAEMSRTKTSDVSVFPPDGGLGLECHYPRNLTPFVLGGLAGLVLLIAQALVTIVGGCICCRSGPPVPPNSPASSNRSVAIICFVACWITFLNAFALLMAGAGASMYTLRRQTTVSYDGQCIVVKPLVFAGGSLLALATVVLDLIFYMASCAAKAAAKAAAASPRVPRSQIALGQPYPSCHRPPHGNAQAYSYPYGPFPHPPHNEMHANTYPNVVTGPFPHPPHNEMHANTYPNVVTGYVPPHPLLVYPNVVTGYPKPSVPSQES